MNKLREMFAVVFVRWAAKLLGVDKVPHTHAPMLRMEWNIVRGDNDAHGNTILSVEYPSPFAGTPALLASPLGEGSCNVFAFEANSLTPTNGAITVQGVPNAPVAFTWLALLMEHPDVATPE